MKYVQSILFVLVSVICCYCYSEDNIKLPIDRHRIYCDTIAFKENNKLVVMAIGCVGSSADTFDISKKDNKLVLKVIRNSTNGLTVLTPRIKEFIFRNSNNKVEIYRKQSGKLKKTTIRVYRNRKLAYMAYLRRIRKK